MLLAMAQTFGGEGLWRRVALPPDTITNTSERYCYLPVGFAALAIFRSRLDAS
jgi:hypothetical protein